MVSVSDFYVITPDGNMGPVDGQDGIYREDDRLIIRLYSNDDKLILWWDNGIVINGQLNVISSFMWEGYVITNRPVVTTITRDNTFYAITSTHLSCRTVTGDTEIIVEATSEGIRVFSPADNSVDIVSFDAPP
jgi:hypothetical protein